MKLLHVTIHRNGSQSMDSEINSLVENNTFTEVPKSDCIKMVGGRWVYTIKDGTNRKDIFKAC